MDHFPGSWGRPRDERIMDSTDMFSQRHTPNEPVAHTKQPIVTGTSVLAITYRDGIMMTADTLGI